MRLRPTPPIKGPCPHCDYGKTDPRSIAEHNLRASVCREARYVVAPRGGIQYIPSADVSRIGND